MILIGIDQSLTCTGVTKLTLDEKFNIINSEYFFISNKVGVCKKKHGANIKGIYIDNKLKGYDKTYATLEAIDVNILYPLYDNPSSPPVYIAIEGYSYGSIGHTFELGEMGGGLKYLSKLFGMMNRVYAPTTVKKFATGKGNAKKDKMWEAFEKDSNTPPELVAALLKVNRGSLGSPVEDMVDSYAIAHLLYLEIRLRHGIIFLRELDPKVIEIFNAVSKKYPVNILGRGW